MSYLDKALVHAKELVNKLEKLIAKEKELIEKSKMEEVIKEYYNSLHSWEKANPLNLIKKIKEL